MIKKGNFFQLISSYRTELMGYGILGVMLMHIVMRLPFDIPLIGDVARFVYTQGFIFLSGFGLYYSFTRNRNITLFYERRMMRLYLPYLIISIPFFLVIVIVTHQDIIDFGGYLTTLIFWVNGNFYGMWYIAVTIFLYALFPLIFIAMFKSEHMGGVILKSCLTILFFILCICLVYSFSPDYYELVGKWIKKTVMFPIGMLCAYFANLNDKEFLIKIGPKKVLICLISVVLFYILTKFYLKNINEFFRCFLGMFLVTYCFDIIERTRKMIWINKIMRWLGTFSLELYVLHVLIFKTVDTFIHARALEMAISVLIALAICSPVHRLINNLLSSIERR